MIKLIKGDCLEVMRDIPSKSVDMILCDLPYGKTQNSIDKKIPFKPLWKEYKRIIKDNGCISLFGQGTFYAELVLSNKKMFRYDLVWDKVLTSGFLNSKKMPLRKHEQVAIFYKKLPTYNPQFTEGKPLHSKGKSYKEKEIINRNYGKFSVTEDLRKGSTQKYPTSILTFPKPHPSIAIHPTQKSVELCEWLIKTYTNEGDLVLDNCMGSGTTGVACLYTNRNFFGIEKIEKIFKSAEERLKKERICEG